MENHEWNAQGGVRMTSAPAPRNDIHARDVMTRQAFENAITVMYALGGSTNGVLHMLALAKEAEAGLGLGRFRKRGTGSLSESGAKWTVGSDGHKVMV